ncbi:hypothetical protein J4233_01810 [Candidatus Pacearchaeota archaeon]|nr:hypothetical protein [Candidatus Pacearchaeota archaeon]
MQTFHKLNKKAQIATSMLVLIALIFSVAALFAMVSFNGNLQFSSVGLYGMINDANTMNNYFIQQSQIFGKSLVIECKDCSNEQILEKGKTFDAQRKIRFTNEGDFFAKLRNGEFKFEKQADNSYTLKIENIHVQFESGYNKIERNFDICQTFNSNGDFIGDCKVDIPVPAIEQTN